MCLKKCPRALLCYIFSYTKSKKKHERKVKGSLNHLIVFYLYTKDEPRLSVIRITASTHVETVCLLSRKDK